MLYPAELRLRICGFQQGNYITKVIVFQILFIITNNISKILFTNIIYKKFFQRKVKERHSVFFIFIFERGDICGERECLQGSNLSGRERALRIDWLAAFC